MSLTVSGNSATNFPPIPEGTYLGVCYMLVDLGMQFSEKFKTTSRKVLVGWEIPSETIELDDGPHARTISKTYTASLNASANLRQDLAAWRGRDFTDIELEAFNLRNVLGKSCLINIIHQKANNGNTYANIQSIMALPKVMEPGKLSESTVVLDLDEDPLDQVERLPKWVGELVKKSITYQDRLKAPEDPVDQTSYLEEDGELPF